MNDRIVSVGRQRTIAVVRFDRGGSLNAFNRTLIREISASLRDANAARAAFANRGSGSSQS
jgi:enoyl-CoA hydratase/carnithine racemase